MSTSAAAGRFTPISFVPLTDPTRDKAAAQGYTRGHSAGYAIGLRSAQAESAARLEQQRAELAAEHALVLRQAQARLDAALSALRAATEAINSLALPVLAEAQDVLLAASVELAEAVIGQALSDGDFAARSAVARALAQPAVPGIYAVRMHPADLDHLDEDTLARSDVRFVPDPELSRGDAVAEFEHGRLDARISTALARAKEALFGEQQ